LNNTVFTGFGCGGRAFHVATLEPFVALYTCTSPSSEPTRT